MRRKIHYNIMLLLTGLFFSSCQNNKVNTSNPVVIGYVGGYRGLINSDSIDADKLTHINYAFIDIKDGKAWVHSDSTDTLNFRKLNELKKVNPGLKILISIGGWSWSENFSDALLTDSSRKLFASSAVDIIRKYDLDGVDIDWEYPAMQGEEDNIFRPEDKPNYTQMFAALRGSLNQLKEQTGKNYLLTTAVGSSSSFIGNTEMDKVQAYLDYINIMTYDFKTEGDAIAGHHTNLCSSGMEPDESSADRSVREYLAAGVPANKIVMGIAFYAHAWKVVTNHQNGLNCKVSAPAEGCGYTTLKDSLANQHGYKRYWDRKSEAPYLYSSEENLFFSYDDEESVKCKCEYVKKHQLAGVMFWEYFSDPKEYLLKEISRDLK